MKLIDLLNIAYLTYGKRTRYKFVDEFIYKEGNCMDLMYHYLDLGYDIENEKLNFNKFHRSQHIWITFLLGLGIAKHYKLIDGVNVINSMPDEYLWMLTSIVHDYGYLKKGVTKEQDLRYIDKYKLLTDVYTANQLKITQRYSINYPQFLTYSYETIKRYYNYRKDELSGKEICNSCPISADIERIDHGIYGACESYKQYCDFYINEEYPRNCISTTKELDELSSLGYKHCFINKNQRIVKLAKTEPLLYKTACLITAQHNLFRSNNDYTDIKYKKYGLNELLSDSPIMVAKDNPLLFLLSIVDTIECTKRFKDLVLEKDRKNCECSHNFGLTIKEVIQNVYVELNNDGIVIDYSMLFEVIRNKCFKRDKKKRTIAMYRILLQHIENVFNLKTWIKGCKTNMVDKYTIKISF